MKKKACKKCKVITLDDKCPVCQSENLTINWKGKVHIIDPEKSKIAKIMGVQAKGEYAIKVR
jgi:DNA-directed RNA polymerase subunit E"